MNGMPVQVIHMKSKKFTHTKGYDVTNGGNTASKITYPHESIGASVQNRGEKE